MKKSKRIVTDFVGSILIINEMYLLFAHAHRQLNKRQP